MSIHSDASSDFDYENNRRKYWWKSITSDNDSTHSNDSEESYESLFKQSELLEQFTNLSLNSKWMFSAAFANIILFVIFTYKVTFNNALFSNFPIVRGIIVLCDVILMLDIAASVAHITWKRYASLRDLPPRHKAELGSIGTFDSSFVMMFVPIFSTMPIIPNFQVLFVYFDWTNAKLFSMNSVYIHNDIVQDNMTKLLLIVIDLMSVIMMFVGFIPVLGKLLAVQVAEIGFIVFRLYRIILYLVIEVHTSGTATLFSTLVNHGIILFLVTHTFTCIIKYMACYKCANDTSNWSTTINDKVFNDAKSPIQWYFVSMWLILGTATSLGAGDIHPVNTWEHTLMMIVMIMGFFILDGAFVGAWTSVQMESYRKHSNFSNRLELIEKSLNHPSVPKKLKNKILKYYRTFWKQNKGVRYSVFFYDLPNTFKQQVYLDMFWNVFEQSYLLTNIHPAFKRAIASVMTTEIYTAGEHIYSEGNNKERMVYLFKGTLQILSAEDSQSPILTLGIGTCLGEANLFFSDPSPVNVKAITYCILQCLKKEDFWRVVFKFRKLKQIQYIRHLMAKKIEKARDYDELRKIVVARTAGDNVLSLKMVKHNLKPERFIASNLIIRRTDTTEVDDYAPTNLYMRSLHHTTLKYSDETCLRTSFPWILQPESTLLTIWECLSASCILFVFTVYPYVISFLQIFGPSFAIMVTFINGIYLFDVIFQIFTAIEFERSII